MPILAANCSFVIIDVNLIVINVKRFSEVINFAQVRVNIEKKLRKIWIMEFDIEISMNIALFVHLNWNCQVNSPSKRKKR